VEFYGHGKLLITGEYAVLDGADSLAIPTQLGQRMIVKKVRGSDLIWDSLNPDGSSWFTAQISLYDFSALKTTDEEVATNLQTLLKNAVRLNPEFLDKWNGFKIETQVEFPRNWGFGSSSTLVYLVAQWADVNPLELYFKTFNGSGYDVACAGCDKPLVYYNDEDEVGYTPVEFNPSYKNNLYFLYLERKQDTATSIKEYLKVAKGRKTLAKEITKITDAVVEASSLDRFRELIDQHEQIMSKALDKSTVKQERFKGFKGTVKSLGAWGGDFALIASDDNEDDLRDYFKAAGYPTLLTFEEVIYKK
jgi:mevalonate kinase